MDSFLICALLALFPLQLKRIVLQLKWVNQFQFAGYYAAVKKAFIKPRVSMSNYAQMVITAHLFHQSMLCSRRCPIWHFQFRAGAGLSQW